MKNFSLRLFLLPLLVLLASCDGGPADPEPDPPTLTSIAITGSSETRAGETTVLTAAAKDQYGNPMNARPDWSSSDELLATVSSAGMVTAKSAGSVQITASASGVSDTHTMTITAAPALTLAEDTIWVTALGVQTSATGTFEGAPADIVLTVLTENRWNANLPVASISGNTAEATGAGTMRLLAHSQSGASTPDTLTVIVTPTNPYVASFSAGGDVNASSPLRVVGYHLTDLAEGALTAGGDAFSLTMVDSANFTATLPAIATDQCESANQTIEVAGGTNLTEGATFRRTRLSEITLAVGDTARLSGQNLCVKVGGPADAEYALAFYDAQFALSQTSEPFVYEKPENFFVTVSDASGAQPATNTSAAISPSFSKVGMNPTELGDHWSLGPSNTEGNVPAYGEWIYQEAPFEVGDTFYMNVQQAIKKDVQVLRVVNNYLTLVSPVDTIHVIPQVLLDSLTQKLELLDREFIPYMTELFGARPETANGQYLVILLPNPGRTAGSGTAGRYKSIINIGVYTNRDAMQMMHDVTTHEMTHSFDTELTWIQYDALGYYPFSEKWHGEGTAEMVAVRSVAKYYGLDFFGNTPEAELGHLLGVGFGDSGEIESGYQHPAALVYDFTWRLAERTGWTWEQANDTLTLGMANNRYGCSWVNACEDFEGLYDVMARHMGAEWNPIDAILVHALSQAADDRLGSEVFVNPIMLNAYTNWMGHGEVADRSGESATSYAPHGGGITVGSTGWIGLSGGGGAFEASSEEPQMEWMLLRIK